MFGYEVFMKIKKFHLALIFSIATLVNPIVDARETDRGEIWEHDAGAPKDSEWPKLFSHTPNYRAFGQAVIGGRGEKFRWIMGPMWYRGRLTPNSVKVFIVGQEGAQDENVSNRSFTGSTGTRMQKFLNYLGIDRSYLFMNTFVYTITGQYSLFGEDRKNLSKVTQREKLLWLAQSEDSIVVEHRHRLFNYMLETNKDTLAVVIGVGTAGKDSVATWFKSHGSDCTSSKLTKGACEGAGELAGVIGVAVRHPGAASPRNGGKDAKSGLVADFQKKADIVSEAIASGKIKMSMDPGMERNFSEDFKYGYASIPHRDFAFGTNWQMGRWATTSNRRGQEAIQVFSQQGCYNNLQYKSEQELREVFSRELDADDKAALDKFLNYELERVRKYSANKTMEEFIREYPERNANDCMGNFPRDIPNFGRRDAYKVSNLLLKDLKYNEPEDLLGAAPSEMRAGDLPFESPKSWKDRKKYDQGPDTEMAKAMMELFKVDYKALGVTQDLDFGPTGIYRGSLDDSRLLVIADQASHTDMFSGRALTGEAGQRLQGFLKALDIGNDYTILRTLPVDTLDLSISKQVEIANNEEVSDKRIELIRKLLERNKSMRTIVFVGPVADSLKVKIIQETADLKRKLKIASLPMPKWSSDKEKLEILKAYEKELPRLYRYTNFYKSLAGFGPKEFTGDLEIIPRVDLPMHTRWWMGTSGDRATRAYEYLNGKKVYNGSYYKFLAPKWAEKWEVSEEDMNEYELASYKKFKAVEAEIEERAKELVE